MRQDRQALDHFGQFLMQHLRDRSIHCFDFLAAGKWRAPSLQRLQSGLAAPEAEQMSLVRETVIACIDSGLHDFLFRLQEINEGGNDVQVRSLGQDVVPLSDGIHGELFGEDGWKARFSQYGKPATDG